MNGAALDDILSVSSGQKKDSFMTGKERCCKEETAVSWRVILLLCIAAKLALGQVARMLVVGHHIRMENLLSHTLYCFFRE